MSVPRAVSHEMIQAELPAVAAYAAAAGLPLATDNIREDHLRFTIIFTNAAGEEFVAELDGTDYPLYPPTIEFLSADGQARGLARLYPRCFHTMPCVCARYNRKAYGEKGGPHNEWRLIDWQLPTGNGPAIDNLTMIVSDLHSKISTSRGRLG